VARDLAHLSEALALEGRVADRENLVHDQDLRLQVRRHGEREPQLHPARVALDRRVDEALDVGERDDLVELPLDLLALHPEDRAVEEDVLATRQVGVEAGADLEQRPDAPPDPSLAFRRVGDARQDLQQGRLPRAVPADDAEHLAALDVEGDAPEGLDLFAPPAAERGAHCARDRVAEAAVEDVHLAEPVALREVANLERVVRRCRQRRAPCA
jgi:hypothetical protein